MSCWREERRKETHTVRYSITAADYDAAETPVPAQDTTNKSRTSDIDQLDLIEREEPTLRLNQVECDLCEHEVARVQRWVVSRLATGEDALPTRERSWVSTDNLH